MDERLINIVKHYDNDAQIRQLIEEMAELTQALNKLWRAEQGYINEYYDGYKKGAAVKICRESVIEETADVMICLEELKHILGISDEKIKQYIDIKLNRQLERMEREENEKHD
ncbi:MAG: hypothetical protein ACLRQ0_09935 [Monoglobales bacterium]